MAVRKVKFTVDSALLQELGERLVGKPHIALAELIKNSYDADATKVEIRFGKDFIEIADDGHGMNMEEFRDYWMRVGSQHKKKQRYSRGFNRFVTGSKGVGRLAVQFLARRLTMWTVSKDHPTKGIEISIDWDDAVKAGDLTEATALYEVKDVSSRFPGGSKFGTLIRLEALNQLWPSDQVVNLAKEVWALQPPFNPNSSINNSQGAFQVSLQSSDKEATAKFDQQMQAWLQIWEARILARLVKSNSKTETCQFQLILEFPDGERVERDYSIEECNIHLLDFEIRVFTLQGRQPHGLKVEDMRTYFRQFGGVHVYDAGFHLPYYGTESDWLGISRDHARRISTSELLPKDLQVFRGLQDLPANARLFGAVNLNTGEEYNAALDEKRAGKGEYLQIQISRDRLVDNKALQALRKAVRWSIDFYSTEIQRRRIKDFEKLKPVEPFSEKFERVEEILQQYQEDIPQEVYKPLLNGIKEIAQASETSENLSEARNRILAPLATTGMAALAFYHEAKKLRVKLALVTLELEKIDFNKLDKVKLRSEITDIVERLKILHDEFYSNQALFAGYANEEDRSIRIRLKAKDIVKRTVEELGILLRGVRIEEAKIQEDLFLPKATYIEWSSLLQNVLLNAVNALAGNKKPRVEISSKISGNSRSLLIQDNGAGVKLQKSEELFEPFVRRLALSSDKQALGVGGMGLGLTIVKMIATNMDCSVSFAKPSEGFNTCFKISWREYDGKEENPNSR